MSRRWSAAELAIAGWGVAGIVGLLVQALVRLTPLALEPIEKGMLTPGHWALYLGWSAFNAYAEGYRGFQKAFVPRVVARAAYLARNPTLLRVLLAPLFCMAMFHARRKNLILSWGLVGIIVALVIAIRFLPQPWRGIVDAGVVVGLGWGTLALLVAVSRALVTGRIPPTDSLPVTTEPPVAETA